MIHRRKNIVAASKAIIFVNTHARVLKYEGATEKTAHYVELFKILGFDSIVVFKDLTKEQIIEQLYFLKSEVFAFKNDQDPQAVFAAAIVNVGY